MPRGNDATEALHELADRFGQGVGNAELLIDANLSSQTQALRKAQILPIDLELTAEARKELREKPTKFKGPDGERVVAIAIRGSQEAPERYTVVIVRDEEGRDHPYALDDDGEPITEEYERRGGPVGRSAHDIGEDEAEKRRDALRKDADKAEKSDKSSSPSVRT